MQKWTSLYDVRATQITILQSSCCKSFKLFRGIAFVTYNLHYTGSGANPEVWKRCGGQTLGENSPPYVKLFYVGLMTEYDS